jgi:hypothetical protein
MNLASSGFEEQNNAVTHDALPFLACYEAEFFGLFASLFSFAGLSLECHHEMLKCGSLLRIYLLL